MNHLLVYQSLFGDFAQLPPVADRPLFMKSSTGGCSFHGYSVYRMFQTVVILSKELRQAGSEPHILLFLELLLHI